MPRRLLWMVLLLLAGACVFAQDQPPQEFPRRNAVVIAVEKTSPAVVNISTEKVVVLKRSPAGPRDVPDDEMMDEFWRRFGMETRIKTHSLGSGVLVHRNGYIITNEHVVRRASKIQVSLLDGSTHEGQLISSDPKRDLAIVKIEGRDDFPVVQMGSSRDLMIGETVIVVGNPFGYSHSVSVGVVSAKNRSVQIQEGLTYEGLIQTDASINPGSSGGPLLDINGRLIGISTAIRAGAEGIGFAVPVDEVRFAMVDLLNFRRIRRTWIGAAVTAVARRADNVPVGLKVTQVEERSPAAEAGLKPDDIIVEMDGQPLTDVIDYEIRMLGKNAGDAVNMGVLRPAGAVNLTLKVARLSLPDPSQIVIRRTGMTVAALDEAAARKAGLNVGDGILVTGLAPDTPAAQASLATGDVILQFGNFRVNRPEDLGPILTQLPLNSRVLVVLSRAGYKHYAWMTVR